MTRIESTTVMKATDMKEGLSAEEVIQFLTRVRDPRRYRIEARVSFRHRIQTLTLIELPPEEDQ